MCRLIAFDPLRGSAGEDPPLDTQSHFTCAALLPAAQERTLVALGTTIGHVRVVNAGRLFASSTQAVQDVTLHEFAAHSGRITALVATGDHTLVSAGADGRLRSWRLSDAGAEAAGDLAAPVGDTGTTAAPQLAGGAGCAVCSGGDGSAWLLQLVCSVTHCRSVRQNEHMPFAGKCRLPFSTNENVEGMRDPQYLS